MIHLPVARLPFGLKSICKQNPSRPLLLFRGIGGFPSAQRPTRQQVQQQTQRRTQLQGQHRFWTSARTMVTAAETSAAQRESHSYVFDPPLATSLPVVAGTTTTTMTPSLRFPVRRIYCVGKNYADHVVEMGGDLKKSKPVFFTKPSFDGVVYAGSEEGGTTHVRYPPGTNNLHYEAELVVAIGKPVPCRTNGKDLPPDVVTDCVYGYAVGIDLTRRDLQGEAKSGGKPWDTGKYFDQSAPMGPLSIRPPHHDDSEEQRDLYDKTMVLTVNGETKQSARLGEMIWKVPEIISELSLLYTLQPGDLIMTGTPSGVGPVVTGDRIRASIDGLVEGLDITLV